MVFAGLHSRGRTSFLCEVNRAMVGGAAGVEEIREAREELWRSGLQRYLACKDSRAYLLYLKMPFTHP